MEPLYKPGEVVCHKASGELAVVEHVIESCKVHLGLAVMSLDHVNGKGCSWEFDGRYRLSLGFDRDSIDVDADLIEACTDDDDTD